MACTLAVGCGFGSSNTARVTGTVTIGGKPIPDDASALITISPASGGEVKPATAPINSGKYEAPNAPTGPVNVTFQITRPVGPKQFSERTGQEYQKQKDLVPSQRSTGIAATITGENPTLDFDL
ncbi:hypothetical protein [Botrimarina colliarenosi]|uniref:hypothetical protein n=1 Tax=Botrimarina colliarenosi TaxID=2528001 RepID=UPI0011B71AC8|nr:hypothetical protein [Botrimarina colliarenosi]